jgi:hypothetical protein
VGADGGIDAAVLDINIEGKHVSPVADRLAGLGVPFLFATATARTATWVGMRPRRSWKNVRPQGLVALIEVLASPAREVHAARA